ncbi:MAG: hypothetical protein OEU26_14330, partial [Candidatus Tectomicrobia bacterium]|nr:hypothetical protein [Candidatus Tectomicrobia bacterium]
MTIVRPPVVAGAFYPDHARQLRTLVTRDVAAADASGTISLRVPMRSGSPRRISSAVTMPVWSPRRDASNPSTAFSPTRQMMYTRVTYRAIRTDSYQLT